MHFFFLSFVDSKSFFFGSLSNNCLMLRVLLVLLSYAEKFLYPFTSLFKVLSASEGIR